MESKKAGKIGRENIEFRLRERERFLRTLIANLPGVVFRSRADEMFTKEFISDGCFDLTGYHAEELVGIPALTNWGELMHPEDRECVFDEMRRLIEREQPTEAEQFQISYRLIVRDEGVKHVRARFRFVHDSLGKISALEGFITDITDQTLADERVRESENRYKLLAENMRDLVCLLDLEGKYLYVSPSSETLLGYASDELAGKSIYDFVKPEDSERLRDEAHARLLKGETGIIIEYRMRDKKGDYYWFETMAQTVTAPSGDIIQLQFVSRDVSNRKEAEEATQKAQEDLAQMLFSEQEALRDADAARVELEHASRAKDEFLQMVSHEFRTPLTTIKTLVRVLQHDGKSETERQKHLETIAAECDRQIDMILNLLDVSRLEEGDADLKNEPVDINSVLFSCDKIERPAADAREQIFTVERDKFLPKVSGDEKAIRRALCAIIENAIKYTPEDGMIQVTARHVAHHGIKTNDGEADKKIAAERFGDLPKQMDFSTAEPLAGEEVAVIVCDSGRGILPEDVPKIFGKFFRGKKPHHDASTDGTPDDAAGKAETPGVGLGLYLAKRLIVALGGRITVNTEVGRGSCFTIFLPVWNEETHEKDTLDEYDFDENEEYDEKRLLAVEDDARLLEAIAVCLEQGGYEVMTARSGKDAFVRIAETIPDLVVSDIMMPRGDGYALVENLRSNPRTDLIPIVFLTAKDGRAHRLNGIRAGVDAYLTKPFEPEELVATIENILTRVSRTHQRVALAANANSGKPVFADDYAAPTNNVNPDNLTDAEERIAALVAQSLSNKEIAARLDISIRTVESHVSHILAKKGFANRVEIARYIVDQTSA